MNNAAPKFKIVYGGKEHTQYTDAGQQYPILTLDDAQYWSGEIQDDDVSDTVEIVEIASDIKSYVITLPVNWDRDGRPDVWHSQYCETKDEVQKFRAKTAVQHSAEQFLIDASLL